MIDQSDFSLLAAVSYSLPELWPLQFKSISAALAEQPSPEAFLNLVERHRVPALAERALSRYTNESGQSLPWLTSLRPLAHRCQLNNLRYHAELLRLQAAFRNAELPVLALKGTEMSLRLYGDIGLRHQRDIDLIVSPNQIPAAFDLLEKSGYEIDLPSHIRRSNLLRLVPAFAYEINCRHRQSGMLVELHWRFERVRNSRYEPIWWRMMLSEAERPYAQILYLCLHGTMHGWSRLKWLGDLHVLFARLQEKEWPNLLAASKELRLDAVLAEVLLLISQAFGSTLNMAENAIVDRYHDEVRSNMGIVLRRLQLADVELTRPRLRLLLQNLRLQIHPASRHTLYERAEHWLRSLCLGLDDIKVVRLPVALVWLYPFIRPFRYLRLYLHRQRAGIA